MNWSLSLVNSKFLVYLSENVQYMATTFKYSVNYYCNNY